MAQNEDDPRLTAARISFIDFQRYVRPDLVLEEVNYLLAREIDLLVRGKVDRTIINMPPRTGKSTTISELFPAYWLGHYPHDKVLQIQYAKERAAKHGAAVRDLLREPRYQAVFPHVQLSPRSAARDRWGLQMPMRGEYHAAGVGGGIAGIGWNLGIIDDPMSEQDKFSQVAKDFVRDWYGPGFYSRRQPERSALVVMMTRWAFDDLVGHLDGWQKESGEYGDKWRRVIIPAYLDQAAADAMNQVVAEYDLEPHEMPAKDANGKTLKQQVFYFKPGDSFAPRRMPLDFLRRQEAQQSNPNDFSALYMQTPIADEGAIIKRKWWRQWPHEAMPKCKMILQFYDTAYEVKEESDYSARTTWGVFQHEDDRAKGHTHESMILLERWKGRLHFPELRDEVRRSAREYKPDKIIIEAKASGKPIYQELRRLKLPVAEWSPTRNLRGREMDKMARTHAAAIVWYQGAVWYPRRRWADDVIEECSRFPAAEHDDLHDTCVMAALWLRKTRWLELLDEIDHAIEQEKLDVYDEVRRPRRAAYG